MELTAHARLHLEGLKYIQTCHFCYLISYQHGRLLYHAWLSAATHSLWWRLLVVLCVSVSVVTQPALVLLTGTHCNYGASLVYHVAFYLHCKYSSRVMKWDSGCHDKIITTVTVAALGLMRDAWVSQTRSSCSVKPHHFVFIHCFLNELMKGETAC